MNSKSLLIAAILFIAATSAFSQSTEFTYQGKLSDGGASNTGVYDFEFRLFDSLAGGTQLGSTQQLLGVQVTNGIFTVRLDFGAQFTGAARFLQISVKSAPGAFTVLAPRQSFTSSPYAIRSANSASADNATNATNATTANSLSASCVGCVTAAQIGGVSGSSVTGTIPVASVPAGSASYIQNQNAAPQATSNFNVSGNGTANIFSATTQFNIGTNRVLSVAGSNNIFAGVGAGSITTGGANTLFGRSAGSSNTTGGANTFIGFGSGSQNVTGSNNTLVGAGADLGANNLTFATAIGVGAIVNSSNTIVLGRSTEIVRVPGDLATVGTVSGGVLQSPSHIGSTFTGTTFNGTTINATGQYEINGSRVLSVSGTNNTFVGRLAGTVNTGSNNSFLGFNAGNDNLAGADNSFFGSDAGGNNTSGSDNTFIGRNAGDTNTVGTNNTVIGSGADVAAVDFNGAPLSFATAIGAGAVVSNSNRIVLGRDDGSDRVTIKGTLELHTLGTGPIGAQLCRSNFLGVGTNVVLNCNSSALRYQTNINGFNPGLGLIKKLRPTTFDWKDFGTRDFGLGAEDVAAIEPLLVTYNEKGEVEGVKYDRIGVVLINAVKEQQKQIEKQRDEIAELKAMLCATNPTLAACKK